MPPPGTRDFTLEKYRELCQAILASNYIPLPVRDYLEQEPRADGRIVVFRHDVDRKIANALRMAELERAMGIRSTYYFRYPRTFNPDVVREVHGLGHEIGYHYEVLAKTRGDYTRAIALFSDELNAFREICDIHTICMHGSPLSRYDNRDLWQKYDFREFGITGEAYISMAGKDIHYFTDTGRSWSGKYSLRDVMPDAGMVPVENTDDFIEFARSSGGKDLYLTVHPERWAGGTVEWVIEFVKDIVVNVGKRILLAKGTIWS